MTRLKAPQRRSQLIRVATKLFARAGYDATTTAAIAAAAGVTEPVLYRHFKSKAELFIAITRKTSEETLEEWRRVIEGVEDPAEMIRRIAAEWPDHIQKLEDAYHVLHGALATSRDRKVLAVIREHYSQIEQFFVGIITRGQEQGVFRRDIDPHTTAWQLINLGIGYTMIVLNLGPFEKYSPENSIAFILGGLKAKETG